MKISAINSLNYLTKSPGFSGILKSKGSYSEHYSYNGSPSSYNGDGHYEGYCDSSSYVYHPFKGESQSKIEEELRRNNYCNFYDSDMTGGYGGSDSRDTVLGRTIPYTEKEWNRLPKREQDRILELL